MEKKHHRDMSAEELVEYARSLISMPAEKGYRERVEVFRQHGMGERFFDISYQSSERKRIYRKGRVSAVLNIKSPVLYGAFLIKYMLL